MVIIDFNDERSASNSMRQGGLSFFVSASSSFKSGVREFAFGADCTEVERKQPVDFPIAHVVIEGLCCRSIHEADATDILYAPCLSRASPSHTESTMMSPAGVYRLY